MENSQNGKGRYSFLCYQKIIVILISNRDLEEYKANFSEIVELFDKPTDQEKNDAVRDIISSIIQTQDDGFKYEAIKSGYEILETKYHFNAFLNFAVQFATLLHHLNRIDELADMLDSAFLYISDNSLTDEIYTNYKLELSVFRFYQLKSQGDKVESKKVFESLLAIKRNSNSVLDESLEAVISEEEGKQFMSNRNYLEAFKNFKYAKHLYSKFGDNRIGQLLKYSILACIGAKDDTCIISHEEIFNVKDDHTLILIELLNAFQRNDINQVNNIWKDKIVSHKDNDEFIKETLNEILHKIRINYVKSNIESFRRCSFKRLAIELSVVEDEIISMCFELAMDINNRLKLNLRDGYFEVKQQATAAEKRTEVMISCLNLL